MTFKITWKDQWLLEASESSGGRIWSLRGMKRLWCRLVELSQIPSVVGYKYLQEGRRQSEVWKGKRENFWDYKV